jgi:hypothetical protein
MELEDQLNEMIKGFENDPPSTEYQEGYLAALEYLRDTYFPRK